jgi:CDGSH-type Zn-finger protein
MEPRIDVRRGGPFVVRDVSLTWLERIDHGTDERPSWRRSSPLGGETPYALCRCGQTTTPPLCDRGADGGCFTESVAWAREPLPVTWEIEGADEPGLALKPHGPARVTGGVPIGSADGVEEWRPDRCSLCRCGHSGAMPFCDGTHKVVGFRDAPSP